MVGEVAVEFRTDSFIDDVGVSLTAWRQVPILPVVTTVLAASSVATIPPHGDFLVLLVGLVVGLFYIGWLGTQFTCYKRAFDRLPVRWGELVPLTWSFIARYLRFYVLGSIPVLMAVFVAIRWQTFSLASPGWRFGVLAYVCAFGAVGTFVGPALAFSTRSVMKAAPIGLRMIQDAWPRNWMYVVVPAIAAGLLGGVYWLVPSAGRLPVEVLTALSSLLFAGPIARYYLRNSAATPALD